GIRTMDSAARLRMKQLIKKIPIVGDLDRYIHANLTRPRPFPGSKNYWEGRYSAGGNSGVGSYGKFAEFKAAVINQFVAQHALRSVIEFGCGDGNQLMLARYPTYLGFDVSETAVATCRKLFAGDANKQFCLVADYK